MATQVIEPKLEGESIEVAVDMLSRLQNGEVVLTAAAAMSVSSGTDPTPGTMVTDLPVISGSVVTQRVQGGLPGVIYTLALSIRTDANNIYINECKLAVLPDDAAIPA